MIDTRAEFFITNDKETSLIFRIPNKIIRIYEQFLYERKTFHKKHSKELTKQS